MTVGRPAIIIEKFRGFSKDEWYQSGADLMHSTSP
jgi:hypothetical protein